MHSLARPTQGPDVGGNLSHPRNGDSRGGEISGAAVSGTGWGKWLGINRNKKGFRLTRSSVFNMWGSMWGNLKNLNIIQYFQRKLADWGGFSFLAQISLTIDKI